MAKLKLRGKDLRNIGYPEGPVISVAITVMEQHYKHHGQADALGLLRQVLQNPEAFKSEEHLGRIAEKLIVEETAEIPLNETPLPYEVYGREFIDEGAIRQMDYAMRLPITAAGALMPDAHQGYGLPIGGVLAAKNAVIPYGVGVDIGCRMCLSIIDIPAEQLEKKASVFRRELIAGTVFGAGAEWKPRVDDAVLESPLFAEIGLLKHLQAKAAAQLSTSGSGNHFVEWGLVDMLEPWEGLVPGRYLALLSHSGSRGLGAQIAGYYTNLAREIRQLPREVQHLAWLDLDSEEGQEYWQAMNLAGNYASACHHHIHRRLIKAVGGALLARVENHHNFAWKEKHNGEELVVHRKGATPAGKGVMGVIPGSMTAPGFIVRGRGEAASLHSASHGAGRQMSRSKATQSFTGHALAKILAEHKVKLIGGGLDEAPGAYKNIAAVMAAQTSLVDVVGKFYPKIVRMAEAGGLRED
ncbi:RNA-splicing ligase RtcB [Chitinophaga alhagiae]|uniref:3'-phosphate/5'-hydroxy nucleic acid ligase n=1 Tax=Chitinophaga alhagiae TaxID=2203219 RepID=A0ABM6WE32_9BACT|nr:RtcB family protein [Chitinophaga alhagiae]AWO02241.1 RNA-splicing ligase RtcB [Chitinophaga alhagiae]